MFILILGVMPGSIVIASLLNPKNRIELPKEEDHIAETVFVTRPYVRMRILGIPIEIAPIVSKAQKISVLFAVCSIIIYLVCLSVLIFYCVRINHYNINESVLK